MCGCLCYFVLFVFVCLFVALPFSQLLLNCLCFLFRITWRLRFPIYFNFEHALFAKFIHNPCVKVTGISRMTLMLTSYWHCSFLLRGWGHKIISRRYNFMTKSLYQLCCNAMWFNFHVGNIILYFINLHKHNLHPPHYILMKWTHYLII